MLKVRGLVLRLLRVPPEPHPPAGRADSVQIFRAAPNYFRFRFALWGLRQMAALAGIIFWLVALSFGRAQWREQQARASRDIPPAAAVPAAPAAPGVTAELGADQEPVAPKKRSRNRPPRNANEVAAKAGEVAKKLPDWALPVFITLEILGVGFFVFQALVSYVVLRLDYEQRWYMVTDRSLRIRSGVWSVWEMTMSFANLQQVVVTQGPMQRWLGLADLKVESAGGGGGQHGHHGQTRSLHVGFFHGVGNASEVRDLILARLREFRQSGLGDPEEKAATPPPLIAIKGDGNAVVAARDLLLAARELRQALETNAQV